MIRGTFDNVPTLFITVGFSNRPLTAGKGGLGLGFPLFCSKDANNAVSSPQTNAPEPRKISISKSNDVSRIFFPKSPYSLACAMPISKVSTASGYSALTYMYPLFAPIAYAAIAMPSRTACGLPSNSALFI